MPLDIISIVIGFLAGMVIALILVTYRKKKPIVFKNLRSNLEEGKEGIDKAKKSLNNFESLVKVMESNAS